VRGGLVCTLKVLGTTGRELLWTDVVQAGQSVELISKVLVLAAQVMRQALSASPPVLV
jgi:hypothetical protein